MPMKTPAHIKTAAATLLLFAAVQAHVYFAPPPTDPPWESGATTVTLSPGGTLTVSGNGAMEDYCGRSGRFYAPWYCVRDSITGVVIEEGVTHIGDMAFYELSKLKSVTIPSSMTDVGSGVFGGCTGLTSITVAAGNANYSSEDGVLFNKDKTTLLKYPQGKSGAYTIPGSVTEIISWTFDNSFVTVAADNKHYSSEDGVIFNKDKTVLLKYPEGKLGAYTVPRGVTSIGKMAFFGSAGLTSVTISDGVTLIGEMAFRDCKKLASVKIPISVTNIGAFAFENCTGLASVTIPSRVARIGEYAFRGCTGLASVTIKGYGTIIGTDAFDGCNSLASITLPADNALYSSVDGVIFNKDKTVLLLCPQGRLGAYTVPSSVTIIGCRAFRGCAGLTSVTIPGSVADIGEQAFTHCTGLTSVTIENGVKVIWGGAFTHCTGLTSVIIPGSVTAVEYEAFAGCTGLTSVTIEDGVTSIGHGAFERCRSLTSIAIPGSVTKIGSSTFQDCIGLTSITVRNPIPPKIKSGSCEAFKYVNVNRICLYVPAGSMEAYRAAEGWKKFDCVRDLASAPEGE